MNTLSRPNTDQTLENLRQLTMVVKRDINDIKRQLDRMEDAVLIFREFVYENLPRKDESTKKPERAEPSSTSPLMKNK